MTEERTTVYTVTATAVYDHGCFGVFTDLEAAEDLAEELYADSDGHHVFRIDRHELDRPTDLDAAIRLVAPPWAEPADLAERRAARERRNGNRFIYHGWEE